MSQRKQKFLYLVSSFLLAVFLFLYASVNNFQSNATTMTTNLETYTNTIYNVPIAINYDSDEFFVSGFTSDVTVQLTSSNRLTLQKESQEATRSFSVVADFNEIDSGVHEVPLQLENVPTGVTATISPETVTVKIGKRASRIFSVEPMVDSRQIEEDVLLTSVTTDDTEVEVTSDEDTLSRVARVVAVLPSDVTVSGNHTTIVTLQAVDDEGRYLSTVVNPGETSLIIKAKKEGN